MKYFQTSIPDDKILSILKDNNFENNDFCLVRFNDGRRILMTSVESNEDVIRNTGLFVEKNLDSDFWLNTQIESKFSLTGNPKITPMNLI